MYFSRLYSSLFAISTELTTIAFFVSGALNRADRRHNYTQGVYMKAAVLSGPHKTQVKEVSMPELGEYDVLVKVHVCGLCISEVHKWEEGAGGIDGVLGHEPVGTIEQMGRSVTGFNIGDRVTGLMFGGFAEYLKADSRLVVKVPSNVDDFEALGEPLSCLVTAADKTPIRLGDSVAVVGLGFMGIGTLQLAKLKGASEIIAIDVREDALEVARKFGADRTYKPDQVPEDLFITDWPHMNSRSGVPVVFEVSGSAPGLSLAGNMTGVHGTLSVVGWHVGDKRAIDMNLWGWKGITVINAHERRNQMHVDATKAAMRLLSHKRLKMKEMVSHTFSLQELDKAFETMCKKPAGFIKGVVVP